MIINIYLDTYSLSIHTYIHASMHACMHACIQPDNQTARQTASQTGRQTHGHTHTRAHGHTYTRTHAHTCTRTHVHTYTFTYTHMHIHICTPGSKTQDLIFLLPSAIQLFCHASPLSVAAPTADPTNIPQFTVFYCFPMRPFIIYNLFAILYPHFFFIIYV